MDHSAGLDVSVKETSVCIVDDTGKIVREVKVASEPEDLLRVLANPIYHFKRIGLEADIGREFMSPRPRAWLHKHSAKCRRGCSDACPLTVLSSIFPKRFGNYLCLQYIFRINKVKRQSNK